MKINTEISNNINKATFFVDDKFQKKKIAVFIDLGLFIFFFFFVTLTVLMSSHSDRVTPEDL